MWQKYWKSLRYNAQLQKWSSIGAVVLFSHILPILIINGFLSIPLLYTSLGHLLLFSGYLLYQAYQNGFYRNLHDITDWGRPFDPNDKREAELFNLLKNFATQLKLPVPQFFIRNNNQGNSCASATDYPYPQSVCVQQKFKGFSPRVAEPILAHEMSHIKNNDSLFEVFIAYSLSTLLLHSYILIFLTISLIVLYVMNFGIGCYLGLALSELFPATFVPLACLIISTLSLAVLYGANVIAQFSYLRAREYIADKNAARMTHDPKAVALMCYELDYPQPFFSTLLSYIFSQYSMDNIRKKNKENEKKQEQERHSKPELFFKYLLNRTHPTTRERYKAIKYHFPEDFKKLTPRIF